MTDTSGTATATATQSPPTLDLQLDVETVKQEVAVVEPAGVPATVDPEVERKASDVLQTLLQLTDSDVDGQSKAKASVEEMGRALQRESAHRSAMLQQPIKNLAEHSEDGGPVAKSLVDLKMQVEDLDPSKFDFSPGWFSRLMGMIPGVGTPIRRYFTKFESAQTVIDAITRSLEQGAEQLRRDNVTLAEDQKAMRVLTQKLQRQVEFGQTLDGKIVHALERDVPADDPRRKFIEEEVMFPLRQRIMDLQQQLAVNQQGVLSMALIVQNNKELIRGVNRALDVTVSALQVAVTVALALANQKIVLDKVNALNRTTSDLISGTAKRLREQGTAIHTQASSAMLDMEALKSAFNDIRTAMDEISTYRREALPKMAANILEFDKLAEEGEKAIRNWEQGAESRAALTLDVE